MLVYLDTGQLAWLEAAPSEARDDFLSMWRTHECELAVTTELLQEAVARGSPERLAQRVVTLARLNPLRGIPTSAGGMMIREIATQVRSVTGLTPTTKSETSNLLFPFLPIQQLLEAVKETFHHLVRFNRQGALAAQLEEVQKTLRQPRPGERVGRMEMAERVAAGTDRLSLILSGEEIFAADEVGRQVAERVEEAGGDPWTARIQSWGLESLHCLHELRPEDLSKAAGFVGLAAEFPIDVARVAGVTEADVARSLPSLRPYEAPGYSIEMAVSRARLAHNAASKASDQVDEEHVSFAPYVDLLFVDKRTRDYVGREVRRNDGRIVAGAADSIRSASSLADVRDAIEVRAGEIGRG